MLGKLTVPSPGLGCVICKFTVSPGKMFVGLINVSLPETRVNVKKLTVERSIEAVFEAILNAFTSPLTEPLNTAFCVTADKSKYEAVNACEAEVAVAAYEALVEVAA